MSYTSASAQILNWLLILDWNVSRQGGGGGGVWEKRAKNVSRSKIDLSWSSEESTWSGVLLTLQSNWSVYVWQSMYNSCISSWKRGTTKCKFSAWKVIILEMECKSRCHERKNLHQFNGHLQHWTEAETKSDSQVESLINVAEVKANFMVKLHYY